MAFPFLFEENFELGTRGDFNSETDTDSKLNFTHYSDLAKLPGLPAPWRGAYAMTINLAGGTNDAYVQEDDGFDLALDGTLHLRFMLFVSSDITMANSDEFHILKLQSAGPVDEAVIVINYTTANGLRIGVGETSGSQFLPLSTGKWHAVELAVVLDDGASNDGTLTLRLDGGAATAVTGLDQAAIAQCRIGAMGIDATTTKGWLLFDSIIANDARVYPPSIRFPEEVLLTKSGHVFVGQGKIENVSLLSGAATDNVVAVYDTDTGNTDDASRVKLELKNTANSEVVDPAGTPLTVQRGAFVQLSGTNPRAIVKIGFAQGYFSDGRIKQHGASRNPAPGGW